MHFKQSTSGTQITRTGSEERAALARLSFALAHVLRLYRLAVVSVGQDTGPIAELEDALGRARLPEEYVDVARSIATLKGVPAAQSGPGISAATFTRFAALFRDMARALELPRLEDELVALARGASETALDPEPLLATARRLVQSLLVQQSTATILDDCLERVDDGIQRMAADEETIGSRLGEVRERLVKRGAREEVEVLRHELINETVQLERLVAERRSALETLQRQSRVAQRRAERLLAALADATTAACTDPLTGLGNRRGMTEAVARFATSPTSVGVLALDVDHFKKVNDAYGHAGGDRVLVQIAEALRVELRGDDHAFRVGGEELVVLLSGCDGPGAFATAERIRARVERTPTALGARSVLVTTSIGVALWKPGQSFDTALDAADEALYEAKRGGRNRSVMA